MIMEQKFVHLIPLATGIERECYHPAGRLIDGAPYVMLPVSWPLVKEFIRLIGGPSAFNEIVAKRKMKNLRLIQIAEIGCYGQF